MVKNYWLLLLLILSHFPDGQKIFGQSYMAPVADHHIHVRSEEGSSAFVRLLKELEGRDIGELPPLGAEEVIPRLDSAGIENASLLSSAYFFGIPDIEFKNEYEKVRDENDYTIGQAQKYPDRLMAFISVNPLRDYALGEIQRCAEIEGVVGIKLHMANSAVDLRNTEHLGILRTIFQEASRLDLAVIIHLFTRNPGYGIIDAENFIENVLVFVQDLKIQIAHMGGAGLYDSTADSVMMAFERAIIKYPEIMDDDLVFDVAASARDPETALSRGDVERANIFRESNRKLAAKIKSIGPDRVVFGTDWVGGSRAPAEFTKTVRAIPLEEIFISELFKNRAPYYR